MTFKKACGADEIWEGELLEVEVDNHVIILLRLGETEFRAYQGVCPHQDIPLVEGNFDGKVIMCRAHQWTFDPKTGQGINPGNCRLAEYPVKLEGDDVLIKTEGVEPVFANV